MNIKRFFGLQTLVVSAAMMSVGVLPMAAQAQSVGSDAAVGAALGSIAGALLFDSNSHKYYYNNGGHRHFVSNQTASAYHRYGGYQGWKQHHGGGAAHGGGHPGGHDAHGEDHRR